MPPKRKAIDRSLSRARKQNAPRASETDEQHEARQQTAGVRNCSSKKKKTK